MLSNVGLQKHVTCPYNSAHVVLSHRLQSHLVKCKRNYEKESMTECHFNSSHKVLQSELSAHHAICPNRKKLDDFIYKPEEAACDKYEVPPQQAVASENWDDDNVPTYNPLESTKNQRVIRKNAADTMSSAVKKQYINSERRRMQELNEKVPPKQDDSKPQRRPATQSEGVQKQKDLKEDDPFDITKILKKINLNSNLVTVPSTFEPATSTTATPKASENPRHKEEYPPLVSPQRGSVVRSGKMPQSQGRGRGGHFYKNG